jgi:hypothetical protein
VFTKIDSVAKGQYFILKKSCRTKKQHIKVFTIEDGWVKSATVLLGLFGRQCFGEMICLISQAEGVF